MRYLKLMITALPFALLLQQCMPAADNKAKENATDSVAAVTPSQLWTKEKAREWYAAQGWLVGSNFYPSTAINQLEMWQAETFDTATINRELGWAADIGMNTARVYLHDLLWEQDSTGFLQRMETFLEIADQHGTKTMFVFFDSVHDPFPKLGTQREPKPHVHNSGWMQSPGADVLKDSTQYPRLERYVKGVVRHFANDERVLAWDVWNEPDNMNKNSYGDVELENKLDYVLPLIKKTFEWVRAAGPSQPLTSAIWQGKWPTHEELSPIQKVQMEQSDVISFHNYGGPKAFEQRVEWLQRYERPLLCTEYMARTNGSTFEAILPLGKKHDIAMYNWGLVNGKAQTIYPWDSRQKEYTAEPELWFHDVFRKDGSPYRKEETELIKQLTSGR